MRQLMRWFLAILPAAVDCRITVVGLGPGQPSYITRSAWRALEAAPRVWLRTAQHPAVAELPCCGHVSTFDDLYEELESFEQVYDAICDALLLEAKSHEVLYAVPGDPCVGERTTALLRQRCAIAGVPFEVQPAVSFVEPSLALIGRDLLPCTTVVDAVEVAGCSFPPFEISGGGTLLCQLYSRQVASNVKLCLMAAFPPLHNVTLLHGEAGGGGTASTLSLCELDREAAGRVGRAGRSEAGAGRGWAGRDVGGIGRGGEGRGGAWHGGAERGVA